ncbi:Ribonuclease H-like protein [Dioscorea alata]|uniref:Ribonuclease H-like protein n=1 Tax=Dioscorea alata TaxID=55571 RepID=A0ACB7W1M0_DIOAL|nr:Ribonuclease H-like protein [Dioscorea alata]
MAEGNCPDITKVNTFDGNEEDEDERNIMMSSHQVVKKKIFKLHDCIIQYVGEKNVIQIITDNASANIFVGIKVKDLKKCTKTLFWTPCVAHCLDLILEDNGKMPNVKQTVQKAISLNLFIYVRPDLVNMLRSFTNQRELVRFGVTRFANVFLTLQRTHKVKNCLRKMFTFDKWEKSKWSKDKKPFMGYIYETMDMAKEAITKSLKENEGQDKAVFDIIDKQCECQLHRRLHISEIVNGVLETLGRLVPDASCQDNINSQNAGAIFGRNLAIRNQNLKSLDEWWKSHGASTPKLLDFIVRVLSLTCSASSCERNWSIFEHRGYDDRDLIDPISLQDIDEANKWLMGKLEEGQGDEELLFGDDGGEKRTNFIASSSRPSKGKYNASSTSLRTPFILRVGDDEEENLGDDYLDEENDKFEEEIDDVDVPYAYDNLG